MREDTTFSRRKLSKNDFSKKYWMGGLAPYQYHEPRIEDGRDEREQFILNDLRAIWEDVKLNEKLDGQVHTSLSKRVNKANKLAIISIAISGFTFICSLLCCLLFNLT